MIRPRSESTPPRVGNAVEVEFVGVIAPSDTCRNDENDSRNNCPKYPINAPENGYQEEGNNSNVFHNDDMFLWNSLQL